MTSLAQISQAHHLHIAGTLAALSVRHFKGEEALSAPYRFQIDIISPVADLVTAFVLGKAASFTIQPIDTAAAALRHSPSRTAVLFSPARVNSGSRPTLSSSRGRRTPAHRRPSSPTANSPLPAAIPGRASP